MWSWGGYSHHRTLGHCDDPATAAELQALPAHRQYPPPRAIEAAALRGRHAVQVATSSGEWGSHTLVLTRGGEVLAFGFGGDGQCGLGRESTSCEYAYRLPRVITALQGTRVVQVATGEHHSLALSEGGRVLSFGNGGEGRLGHGDEGSRFVPTTIEALRNERVAQVAAGDRFSVVLTEGHKALWFGERSMTRFPDLSDDEDDLDVEGESQLLPATLADPCWWPRPDSPKIVEVAADASGGCRSSIAVLSESGEVCVIESPDW